MTAIEPGMRVRCVDNDWANPPPVGYHHPAIGQIVTVIDVFYFIDIPCVILLEFTSTGYDGGYQARHFLPLDGDAELSILRSIAVNPSGYVELSSREVERVD